jgi:hypothetical protein
MQLLMNELLEDYHSWLKKQTKSRAINAEWVEITTPFTNRSNDLIQIFVRKKNDSEYELSDSGDTLMNLSLAGYELSPEKKVYIEEKILYGYGLNIALTEELKVTCRVKEFPQRLHDFIQAILQVDDLSFQVRNRTTSYFLDEVWTFLQEHQAFGSPNVRLSGRSSLSHKFDILIPQRNKLPEVTLKIANSLKRDRLKDYLFMFDDVKKVRDHLKGAIIINDRDHTVDDTNLTALVNYDIDPCLWSARESWIKNFQFIPN